MLCLGNDVILTITPKWAAPGPELLPNREDDSGWERSHAQYRAARDGTTVPAVDGVDVAMGVAAETLPGTHELERLISAQAKCIAAGVPAGKKGGPASADTMSMTLVHGDMLMFSGCDFEVGDSFSEAIMRY